MTTDMTPSPGWIADELAEEFPELRLYRMDLTATARRSPKELRARLRDLANRMNGPRAVALRQAPVPHAYRVFYRHVGLDPDRDRVPIEAAALERLMKGGLPSRNTLDDALTIAVLETGVPIWALDGGHVVGDIGLRLAEPGERLGRAPEAPGVPAGRMVVADAESAIAVLFGDIAPGHGVTKATGRLTLFSVQVAGVPSIHVEEALWLCAETVLG